ncbi:MAG TPA: ABC transporter permease [Blastocatellia bacterium]|nr:ABC transporter permease [Blastocatellia bacterium]
MDTLIQDLRYAARTLRSNPGFTVVALLTLALGIGANTAIFSVVNAVLLKPVPFRESGRSAVIWVSKPSEGRVRSGPSGRDYLDWREQSTAFEDMILFEHGSGTVTGGAEAEQVPGLRVSANFTDFLGIKPYLGRAFLPGEDVGTNNNVILSYSYWQRQFGSDPDVLGRSITLNSESYTIIGVLPPNPWTFFPADVVVPWSLERLKTVDQNLGVVARLRPGVTFAQATGEMNAIAERIAQARPDDRRGWGVTVVPVKDVTVEYIRPALLILFGAVGLVLLIACANVANLLLARAVTRQKEIAVRIALGAGRVRLMRQFLVESLVLGLAGGFGGLLLAAWGSELLFKVLPATIPVPDAAADVALPRGHIDITLLAFTLVISMIVGVAFGLAPALATLKSGPGDALKAGGRGPGTALGSRRPRAVLVIAETALAVVLVIGSGLMIKSFWRLLGVSPGFDPRHLLTLQIKLPADARDSKYRDRAERASTFKEFLSRVNQIPGVQAAAITEIIPLSQDDQNAGELVIKENQHLDQSATEQHFSSNFRRISPGYFAALGIPLQAGREFSDSDSLDRPRVVIVDDTLAHRYFGAASPIGQHIQIPDASQPPREIVGVVGSVLDDGLDKRPQPTLYLPYYQSPTQIMSMLVRTNLEPAIVVPAVRSAISSVDKDQPVFNVRRMEDITTKTVSANRIAFVLLAVFASIALALASVGIYGVTSFAVSHRTNEIGVRVALGATGTDVLRLIVGQGMGLAFIGVILGLIGALWLSRLLSGLLYDVVPTDAATFSAVAAVLLGVALLANYAPARRATSVDPTVALRYD